MATGPCVVVLPPSVPAHPLAVGLGAGRWHLLQWRCPPQGSVRGAGAGHHSWDGRVPLQAGIYLVVSPQCWPSRYAVPAFAISAVLCLGRGMLVPVLVPQSPEMSVTGQRIRPLMLLPPARPHCAGGHHRTVVWLLPSVCPPGFISSPLPLPLLATGTFLL